MRKIEIGPPYGVAASELLIKTVESVGTEEVMIVLGPGDWAVNRDLTIPGNITLAGPGVSGIGSEAGAVLTLCGDLIGGQIFPHAHGGKVWWGDKQEPEG